MSHIIAGLALIAFGLVGAFFGYRIFRVLLPIYGGVGGFLLAWGWWGENAWLLALIVGAVLAIVFAALAYSFWSAMVAFGGLIMGGALGVVIGTSLNLWSWLTVLLAIGLGIVFAALFYWIRNEMVIISTASTGATLVGRGVGELFGWRSGLEGVVNPNSTWLTILVFGIGIVAFIAGLLYQWRAYAKLHWYDAKVAKDAANVTQAAAATTQSYATRAATTIDAAAGAAGSAVTGGAGAVAGAAAAAATAATVTVTDGAGRVFDAAGAVATDVKADVADAADAVDDVKADVADAVEAEAADVIVDAKANVADAADVVEAEAADAVSDVKADVADVADAVEAEAADVVGDVKADVADAADVVEAEAADTVSDVTADVADVADAVVDEKADVADAVEAEAADAVSDVTADVADAADVVGDAKADVANAADAVEAEAADLGGMKAGIAGALAGAGALFSDAGEKVADAAGEAQDAVADAGSGVANRVEAVVESAAKALNIDPDDNKVADALAALEKSFEGLAESAKFKEALEFIEGIGPVFAGKLKDVGVNNVLELLRQGATRKGRAELAEKSGIAGKLILEWVNHADLYRVKGVGSEFADLLEAAGVDTVPELAQRNPVRLLEKMLATNDEKKLVRRAPYPSDVENWVTQAKNLPRIIQY